MSIPQHFKDEDKCPVCGETGYQKFIFHGRWCCTSCEQDFCFKCGRHPVKLFGPDQMCEDCTTKAGVAIQAKQVLTICASRDQITKLVIRLVRDRVEFVCTPFSPEMSCVAFPHLPVIAFKEYERMLSDGSL